MPRVVHFEVSADEPERAAKFYTEVFGWQLQKWDGPMPYWLITTGPDDQPGINGGMFVRKGPVGYVNTVQVESVDEAAARVTASGGRGGRAQDADPGRRLPGVLQGHRGEPPGHHAPRFLGRLSGWRPICLRFTPTDVFITLSDGVSRACLRQSRPSRSI